MQGMELQNKQLRDLAFQNLTARAVLCRPTMAPSYFSMSTYRMANAYVIQPALLMLDCAYVHHKHMDVHHTQADRIEYKFKFIHDFAWKVRELADTGVPVVVVGDLNTSILDHDNFLPSAQCLTSCFLPEERLLLASITYIPQTLRDYLNKYRLVKKDVDVRRAHHHRRITLLQTRRRNAEKKSANSTQKLPPIPGWDDPIVVPVECGIYDKVGELPQPSLIDAFRYFYPNVLQAYTCWDTVRSFRRVNKGARIDVTLVSPALLQVEAHTIQQRYLSVPDTCGTDTAPTRR
uniref:DNA-(Apurinic or apyrimidinic site) lyase 2 n=1 Tax=Lygus hesperus TaxID=30085 RepID=A0A0A9X1D5_LYGHE